MTRKGLALLLIFLATGFASNQALSRSDIFANIGTGFSWSGAAQSWGSDHTLATKADATFLRTNGSCAPGQPSSYVMVYSDWQACSTAGSAHTPILANNTFSSGSFLNWTDDTTTGCTTSAVTFGGIGGADQDGDSGSAEGGSGATCTTSASTIGLNQTFSVGAAPTVQSYSLWYQAPVVSAGDGVNCDLGYGSAANLTVKINGTVAGTLSALTLDTNWHQFTGTTTLLVNGSNTIDVTAALTSAYGHTLRYNPKLGDYECTQAVFRGQILFLDNISLTATY